MMKRARLAMACGAVVLSAPMALTTRGQPPVACYELRYSPDSLGRYLPPRVRLLSSRRAHFRDRHIARWEATPGWSDASQIIKLTRGYGAWWQRGDSLFLEAGEAMTAMPVGRLDLGSVQEGERAGTLYLDFGGSDVSPHATGLVRAMRTKCVRVSGTS